MSTTPVFPQASINVFTGDGVKGGMYVSSVFAGKGFATVYTTFAISQATDGGSGINTSAVEVWTRPSSGLWVNLGADFLQVLHPASGAFTYAAAPGALDEVMFLIFLEDGQEAEATLNTAFGNTNANVDWSLFTSRGVYTAGGLTCDDFAIQYVDPGVANAVLTLDFNPASLVFTFSLGTDGNRHIVTTANDLTDLSLSTPLGFPFALGAVPQGTGNGVVPVLPPTQFSGAIAGDSTWDVQVYSQLF